MFCPVREGLPRHEGAFTVKGGRLGEQGPIHGHAIYVGGLYVQCPLPRGIWEKEKEAPICLDFSQNPNPTVSQSFLSRYAAKDTCKNSVSIFLSLPLVFVRVRTASKEPSRRTIRLGTAPPMIVKWEGAPNTDTLPPGHPTVMVRKPFIQHRALPSTHKRDGDTRGLAPSLSSPISNLQTDLFNGRLQPRIKRELLAGMNVATFL